MQSGQSIVIPHVFAEDIQSNKIPLKSEEPPKYKLYKNRQLYRVHNEEILDNNWTLNTLNNEVYEKFLSIEQLLALSPPDPETGKDSDWYKFAMQLRNVSLPRRHSRIVTSPLLIWYVYIAKYSPDTIYTLFNDRQLDFDTFSHLVQFGFLEDWWKHVHFFESLLLYREKALMSLAISIGEAEAKQYYIRAFFDKLNKSSTRISQKNSMNYSSEIRINNLLFAYPDMTALQKQQAKAALMNRVFAIDPRHVERLKYASGWNMTDKELLSLIKLNEYREERRMMSSFFTEGAKYGDKKYFEMLLNDAELNDSQPNNFYCSACALAILSDGLVGTTLLKRLKSYRKVNFTYNQQTQEYILR